MLGRLLRRRRYARDAPVFRLADLPADFVQLGLGQVLIHAETAGRVVVVTSAGHERVWQLEAGELVRVWVRRVLSVTTAEVDSYPAGTSTTAGNCPAFQGHGATRFVT